MSQFYQRVGLWTSLRSEFDLMKREFYMLKEKQSEKKYDHTKFGEMLLNHVQVGFSESAVKALENQIGHTARVVKNWAKLKT